MVKTSFAYQISMISQSTAEILLLPVSLFTCLSSSASHLCASLPNLIKKYPPPPELWRNVDFSRWRPAVILVLIWVMVDHPRRAIVPLSLALKFCLDRMYSFRDVANYANFSELRAHFLQMTSPIVLPPKRPKNYVVWATEHENRSSGSTWAQDREKKTGLDKQKVMKWQYFA